jgi:hypothetical protein
VDDPDLAITIDRSDLEQVMMGVKSFAAQIDDGTAQTEGDLGVLGQLASTMVDFELLFEILPGTKEPSAACRPESGPAAADPRSGRWRSSHTLTAAWRATRGQHRMQPPRSR